MQAAGLFEQRIKSSEVARRLLPRKWHEGSGCPGLRPENRLATAAVAEIFRRNDFLPRGGPHRLGSSLFNKLGLLSQASEGRQTPTKPPIHTTG